jgi:PAS domain S-box-containing protein
MSTAIPLRILILEDQSDDAELMAHALRQAGIIPDWSRVDTEEDFVRSLEPPPELILSDHSLPQFSSVRALARLRERGLEVPFIIVSGTISQELAIGLLEQGVDDFVLKDRLGPLGSAVLRALERKQLREEKRLGAQKLLASERRFRALIEHSADGIVLLGREATILYASPSTERILGYDAGELIGLNIFNIVHPGDVESVRARFEDSLERPGVVVQQRLRVLHKDLSWRWIETVGSNLLAEPDVQAIVVNYRDITERVQAEEQLRKLSRAIEQSPTSVMITDLTGALEYVNPKFTEVTGYTLEEVRGMNPRFLKSGEMSPEEYRQLWESIKAGGEWHGELHNKKKNGELFWESASISPVLDEHGVVTHYVAIKEDVTASKRAEAELRLRTRLIDLAHDAILIRQPGNVISYWNNGAERIYGWTKDQALGQISHELLKSQFPERLAEIDATLLREGTWEGELVRVRADGQLVVISSRWVIDRNGHERGAMPILEISSDITARKRVEEVLRCLNGELARQASQLARSNRELEQFAYVASHDLQEPLRMVASYLELVAERYKGRLDEKADKFIAYAVDGATRMKRLIDDLLGYSRVSTRAQPAEVIDVGAALEEATKNLGKVIAEKEAVVTWDVLPTVVVNRTHLVQLFQNLIGNALKFCVELPRIHVGAQRDEQAWVFSVRDNGIGIAPEHRERIFQIFQRLHGRDKYAGTGIGLAICKKIVEQYGGRIWVESQPGKGSTFFFTLPAVD